MRSAKVIVGFAGVVVIVGVGIISFFAAMSRHESGAELRLFERSFDAGVRREPTEQTVIHGFRFVNEGSEPLIISDVRMSCGCTVVNVAELKKTYEPGEGGVVTVRLTLPGIGRKTTQIAIVSNAASSPDAVEIAGTYLPDTFASVVPVEVDMGMIRQGENCRRELSLDVLMRDKQAMRIRRIDSRTGVIASVVESEEEHARAVESGYFRKTFKVGLELKASTIGKGEDSLEFILDPAISKSITVPVRYEVTPTWRCRPSKVIFVAPAAKGESRTGSVVITGPVGSHARIREIENPIAEWLELQSEATSAENEAKLLARVKDWPHGRSIEGTIVIEMRDDVQSKILLPVKIFGR